MARRRNTLLFALSTRLHRPLALCLCGSLLVLPALPQQSGIQSSFLPAIIRTPVPIAFLPEVVETEHLPYLTEVTRENQGKSVFHPSQSDMLIQQAEEKFRSGSRFYANSDFDHA